MVFPAQQRDRIGINALGDQPALPVEGVFQHDLFLPDGLPEAFMLSEQEEKGGIAEVDDEPALQPGPSGRRDQAHLGRDYRESQFLVKG